ncbi:hypothetical protein POPTR_003G088500v4 [Populus trichocarpa]|jgi:hypothetical protein|uniref:Uncharacterized protein n=1 Tax=Populus trichocarpa TaxID=3694 RepID=B9N2Q9_POPTR|nr:uncharacterized protein LOC18096938 [Populus trichocarpa]KAI5594531.1 hypothetical protein BDE02_03G078600 [Populus trichocarpa]PNT44488.1 hypothetical protein POPTR_003G088500v4 [Populus trichocarpa]|eukprot:XP_006385617.1 uncharacterized protein LOC18096938 [Populus trichocarpa]
MKLSLNLQDDHQIQNPLLKAKLPISILNQPFTSILTTTTTNSISDLTLALSTNFPTGPSLKLTYTPSTTTTISPFSLSLKSGLGLFGSPHDSPLVFSAQFSLPNSSSNLILPSFSLQFKPQFGHFSLHKRTTTPSSNPNYDLNCGSQTTNRPHLESGSPSKSEPGNGFASDGSSGWQELKLEPCNGKEKEGFVNHNYIDDAYGIGFSPERQLMWKYGKKRGFFSGVGVKAKTALPLTKRVLMNLRWAVNFPGELGIKMPYLIVNKIGIERVEELKEVKKEKSNESNLGDLELLKGMCFWMTRDLEVLEAENREMKHYLENMRLGILARNSRKEINGFVKRVVPASSGNLGGFEQWRSNKNNGEGNGQREELKKPAKKVTDLESELQKAIKAASS